MEWLHYGDSHTKFFHTVTLITRKKNQTESLQNYQDMRTEDVVQLKKLAMKFYGELFAADLNTRGQFIMGRFPKLDEAWMSILTEEYSMEEVHNALKEMGSY